ncbi:RDD family protein [Algibacter amylolyticus]|uniref:RDD family protein n=1 Tax=Algibacter amylolyticus TaxID=1608400 RepID=A0A5M7BCY2_9FLAO|nr:RDD family protein [Algibacter amylolyticus]KAA5827382.1 RDD family protein [Algibacter amylolyticus]MBB5266573.1 putative RDD family membrane protein YckC [Algibacter amylolyticus]TSJ81627.1 RDD family protein [Algibacter amylolyticus]
MTETNNNNDGIIVGEISKIANSNPRINRVLSMLLDHFIMCLLIVPLGFLIFGLGALMKDNLNNGIGMVLVFLPFFVYLNKDFFNAKSPAKRILGFQVIDRKTNNPANELQCFVRNLTICVAWPLEVIVGLINPERRIGDFLANTKVITSEKQKLKSIFTDLKNTNLKINFIGILIIGGIYFYGLSLLLPSMN